MHTYPSLTTVLMFSLVLTACDGGSSSGRSGAMAPAPPPESPPVTDPPDDYNMPSQVNVLPPDTDFELACDNIAPPAGVTTPPLDRDDTTSAISGFLIDSAVSGVAYRTPSIEGTTSAEGTFLYQEGETVNFELGGTSLGNVKGMAQVTPFNLAGSDALTGMPAITNALENDNHPFHTVINTAVLLQSLDEDGEPGNGIVVSPERAVLFAGISLDMNQAWHSFENEYWLGLLKTVNPARALAHLYSTLGIEAHTYGISMEESDWNGDGIPEDSMRRYYDTDGNLVRLESGDEYGTWSSVENWTYNTNGQRTTFKLQQFGQQFSERWTYHSNGDLTEHELNEGGHISTQRWTYQRAADGTVLRAEMLHSEPEEESFRAVATFEYNENDQPSQIDFTGNYLHLAAIQLGLPTVNLLSFATAYTIAREYNAAGVLAADTLTGSNPELGYHIVKHRYDAHGNVVHYDGRLMQYGTDSEEQRTISKYQYEYDSRGNITKIWTDEDGNGRPDLIESHSYDQHDARVLTEWDYDANGSVDDVQRWPYEYEYDASGNIVSRTIELNGDDDPEEITSYSYYKNGNVSEQHLSSREVGEHEMTTWQYDASGKLLRKESDYGGEAGPDKTIAYGYDACGGLALREIFARDGSRVSAETWQYDADGDLRRYEWDDTLSPMFFLDAPLPENLGDYQISGLESWQYDSLGRLIRYKWHCEGGCEVYQGNYVEPLRNQTVNTEFDDAGRVTRELIDKDSDGRTDEVTVFEYDATGNVTRMLRDRPANGVANEVVSYAFDANGNLLRQEEDHNGDGILDSVSIMEYDAHGNIMSEFHDDDEGDATGETATFMHQYDSIGNHTRQEEDWNGDGVADRVDVWTYNASGNLTQHRQEETDDGEHIVVESWQYDSNGNLLRAEYDEQGDGIPERTQTYQYDASGNLIRESEGWSYDGNGIMGNTETRHYVPTGWGHILENVRVY
ncbi:MAG: hypothetical protein V7754_05775 [Halioglobus sp.]